MYPEPSLPMQEPAVSPEDVQAALDELDFAEQTGEAQDEAAREEQAALNEPAPGPFDGKAISIKFGRKREKGIPAGKWMNYTKEEFTYEIAERIRLGISGRRDGGFDDQVRYFRDQYEGRLEAKSEPWENCSNFNVPLSQPIADTLHANYYATFFKQSKYFIGELPAKVNLDDASMKEDALQYIMENIIDLPHVGDELILRSIIDQRAIAKIEWDRKVERRLQSSIKNGETYKELVTLPVFDGVKVSVIDILDYGFYPADATAKDQMIGEWCRYWASTDELYKGAFSGKYDHAAVESLTSMPADTTRTDEYEGGNESRLQSQGINTDEVVNAFDKPYEVYQGLFKWDCEGDGIDCTILIDIAMQGETPHNATLLRAVYYDYNHGRSFFVPFSPFIRPGYFYCYSLMERLEDVQAEINAIQNMRTDRATLENNAPYVASSTLKRQLSGKKVAPGMVLYDDNPKEAILPVSFGTGSQRDPAEVQFIRSLGEDIAGVNSTTMGRATGDATKGENEMARQGVNIKFDVQLSRLSRGFEELAQQVSELYAQYQPPAFEFAVKSGGLSWDFKSITREQMSTKMGFRVRGTSSLANPEFRAYIGEKLIVSAQNNPLISNNLPRLWETYRYYYENVAGIEDYERYIGTREEAEQQQAAMEQAEPPKEERSTVSYGADEIATLAHLLQDGTLSPEMYQAAAELAAETQMILMPMPQGVNVGDATDDAAGYEQEQQTGVVG
jgi:hypothetical protein